MIKKQRRPKVQCDLRPGSRLDRRKAGIVVKELRSLRKEHGELTAPIVVDAAKSRKHPLHSFFQWDDTKAAHEFRLEQARHLMRSVTIIDVRIKPTAVRAFVAYDHDSEPDNYVPMMDVLTDVEYRRQLVEKARKELRSWLERYDHLSELKAECTAIQRVLDRGRKIRRKAS